MMASEWTCADGVWTRCVGMWFLTLEQHAQSYSGRRMWGAVLTHGSVAWGNNAVRSAHLGAVAEASIEDVQRAADAWLVDVTRDLLSLVGKGVRDANG